MAVREMPKAFLRNPRLFKARQSAEGTEHSQPRAIALGYGTAKGVEP